MIGLFYLFVAMIGLGGRAILGPEGLTGRQERRLSAPHLAHRLGGGPGSTGGDIFFASITAVAFTTILAVVSGVVLAASGAVAHDVYGGVMRRGTQEVRAGGRIGVLAVGAIGSGSLCWPARRSTSRC